MYTDAEIERLAEQAAANMFQPIAFYNSDSDSIEFFVSNESYYAESLDSLVTVYYSQETNAVVGIRLKKAKSFFQELLRKSPGFRREIHDHRIKVEHLFTAMIWSSDDNPEDARVITYLRDVAKEKDVEAEIEELFQLVA